MEIAPYSLKQWRNHCHSMLDNIRRGRTCIDVHPHCYRAKWCRHQAFRRNANAERPTTIASLRKFLVRSIDVLLLLPVPRRACKFKHRSVKRIQCTTAKKTYKMSKQTCIWICINNFAQISAFCRVLLVASFVSCRRVLLARTGWLVYKRTSQHIAITVVSCKSCQERARKTRSN